MTRDLEARRVAAIGDRCWPFWRGMRIVLLAMALSCATTGCLVPCEIGAGFTLTNANAERASPKIGFETTVGIHPAQFNANWLHRDVDVGAGGVLDFDTKRITRTGYYLEGTGIVSQRECGTPHPQSSDVGTSDSVCRVEVGGQARLTWDETRPDTSPAFGLAPVFKSEVATFIRGGGGNAEGGDAGYGELAGGVFVMGVFDARVWSVMFGAYARLPFYVIAAGP